MPATKTRFANQKSDTASPGWRVVAIANSTFVDRPVDGQHENVCEVLGGESQAERLRMGRLIAAAPSLEFALRALLDVSPRGCLGSDIEKAKGLARAAIAKCRK